jgi:hypothetical protein
LSCNLEQPEDDEEQQRENRVWWKKKKEGEEAAHNWAEAASAILPTQNFLLAGFLSGASSSSCFNKSQYCCACLTKARILCLDSL